MARLVQVAFDLFMAFKNRREFYRLGEMSDAELADIGLTRADLHVAYGHPLGTDPTSALSVIVRRRAEDEEAVAPARSAEAKLFRRRPRFIPAPTGRLPIARSRKGPGIFRSCMAASGNESTLGAVTAITARDEDVAGHG